MINKIRTFNHIILKDCTITSRLIMQLEPTQFVHTQVVGAYFRVQGFPNCLCFATMSKKSNGKHLNLENKVIFSKVLTLYISMFSTSRISCSALSSSRSRGKHSMTRSLRNRLNHFRTRFERLASNPNTKKFKTYIKWRLTTSSTNKS